MNLFADPEVIGSDVLQIKTVDLEIRSNTRAHHTNEFDITDATVYDTREELVVRRGQTFNVSVTFNRQFKPTEDELKLVFEFGTMVGYDILFKSHIYVSRSH